MKMDEILAEKKTKKKGTYAGLKFSSNTTKMIKEYMGNNNIPNPLPVSKLHSTLLYSRKHLPEYEPTGKFDESWTGDPTHFSIFKSNPKNSTDNTNCLVLEYTCKEQSARFDDLMNEHDATYDFDDYKPHITLSYDVGDLDHDNLTKLEKALEIVEEYGEDLKLD